MPVAEPAVLPPPVGPRRVPLLLRLTAVVATVGVVIALVGLVLLARPVVTPVQDCGTSIGFLLDGRQNVFVDPAAPPPGVTEAEAVDNNERPCRERVADRAVPAAGFLFGGVALSLAAAATEAAVRVRGLLRRRATGPPINRAR